MEYRETTVTVYGTTRTIRTERGRRTVGSMETAHTRAVRAALKELHEVGKAGALAAAHKTARAAEAAAARNHTAVTAVAAHDARDAVARIEKRKFATLPFPDFKAMTRPHARVKFDLAPTDPALTDAAHEVIDPDAPAAAPAPVVEAPRTPMGARNFLDSLLAAAQPPAAQEPTPEDPTDLQAFLDDFFNPAVSH